MPAGQSSRQKSSTLGLELTWCSRDRAPSLPFSSLRFPFPSETKRVQYQSYDIDPVPTFFWHMRSWCFQPLPRTFQERGRQARFVRVSVSSPPKPPTHCCDTIVSCSRKSVRGITISLSRYNAQRLSGPGYSGTQDLVLPGIRVRTSSVLEYRCRHHSLSRVCTWAADAAISCTAAGAGPCPMLGRAVHGAAAPVLAVACRCVCVRRGLPHL